MKNHTRKQNIPASDEIQASRISTRRVKITSIAAGHSQCANMSAKRISVDIATKISCGATIYPVTGIWIPPQEHSAAQPVIEVSEKAFAIDVTVPSEQRQELLNAIKAAFQKEASSHSFSARWIHTEIIELEAAHWQIENLGLAEKQDSKVGGEHECN